MATAAAALEMTETDGEMHEIAEAVIAVRSVTLVMAAAMIVNGAMRVTAVATTSNAAMSGPTIVMTTGVHATGEKAEQNVFANGASVAAKFAASKN